MNKTEKCTDVSIKLNKISKIVKLSSSIKAVNRHWNVICLSFMLDFSIFMFIGLSTSYLPCTLRLKRWLNKYESTVEFIVEIQQYKNRKWFQDVWESQICNVKASLDHTGELLRYRPTTQQGIQIATFIAPIKTTADYYNVLFIVCHCPNKM